MKQIIYIVITTLLSIPLCSDAQDIKWGPHYAKSGGMFSRYMLMGSDDDHYYINMEPLRNGTLLKYDYDHKLKSKAKINLKYGKVKIIPTDLMEMTSKTFATMPKYKDGVFNFYVSEFDNGKFGEVKDAYEYKLDDEIQEFRYGFNYVDVSENKKYGSYTVSYSIESVGKDKVKDAQAKAGFVVFDENMDIVWQKRHEFPYKDKNFIIGQTIVSDKGDIFCTAILLEDGKGMRPFEYKVLHVTEGGVSEIDVKLTGSNKVSDLALFIDNTDQLYLGGFYGKDIKFGENTAIDGVFFGEINMKSKSILVKTHKFKTDFLEGLIDEKDLKKGKGYSYQYGIKELISFEDGTFSFLAENSYQSISADKYQRTSIDRYYSNGMIIPKFNKDGSLIHIEKIDNSFLAN